MCCLTGIYTEVDGVTTKKTCVLECCVKEDCNVAFMTDQKCYHIKCTSNDVCIPVENPNMDYTARHVSMVLVKPISDREESWEEILNEEGIYVVHPDE